MNMLVIDLNDNDRSKIHTLNHILAEYKIIEDGKIKDYIGDNEELNTIKNYDKYNSSYYLIYDMKRDRTEDDIYIFDKQLNLSKFNSSISFTQCFEYKLNDMPILYDFIINYCQSLYKFILKNNLLSKSFSFISYESSNFDYDPNYRKTLKIHSNLIYLCLLIYKLYNYKPDQDYFKIRNNHIKYHIDFWNETNIDLNKLKQNIELETDLNTQSYYEFCRLNMLPNTKHNYKFKDSPEVIITKTLIN